MTAIANDDIEALLARAQPKLPSGKKAKQLQTWEGVVAAHVDAHGEAVAETLHRKVYRNSNWKIIDISSGPTFVWARLRYTVKGANADDGRRIVRAAIKLTDARLQEAVAVRTERITVL